MLVAGSSRKRKNSPKQLAASAFVIRPACRTNCCALTSKLCTASAASAALSKGALDPGVLFGQDPSEPGLQCCLPYSRDRIVNTKKSHSGPPVNSTGTQRKYLSFLAFRSLYQKHTARIGTHQSGPVITGNLQAAIFPTAISPFTF